ncbi:MAG TPA: hypothetical protein VJT73_10990 [Polyangiaceae bacterium]|nr:hypothetical protein [Polyangiaceae bacterium]
MAAVLGIARAGNWPSRGPDETFDLAVQKLEVTQTASTSMFREIAVRCVVQNRGPQSAHVQASVIISRPGDDEAKVLKKTPLPDPFAPGDEFVTRAEGSAWFASSIPYRCEIQFEGRRTGDADTRNDAKELVYPRL